MTSLTVERVVQINKVLRNEVAVVLPQPQLVRVVLGQLVDDVIGTDRVQLAKLPELNRSKSLVKVRHDASRLIATHCRSTWSMWW